MSAEKQNRSGSETRKRNEVLRIRMTFDELAEVKKRANDVLLTPASFARFELLNSPPPRSVRRPSVEAQSVARVLAQLGKIGSNLNQIAHQMNAGGTPTNEILARALSDVSVMRDACMSALNRKP